jgi:hypothetical protein
MNLRHQRKRVALAGVLHAHGPSADLGRAEIHAGIGGGVSAVLVEDEISGLQVDGILEFLGCALVGPSQAGRVGLKVDLHVATRGHVARFLVVGKVVPVNLVEAGGIAAVENNADVMQFGAAIQLELF